LVLVINDNVILYVTNVCFTETNGKLGRITGRCTTTVKTIPEIELEATAETTKQKMKVFIFRVSSSCGHSV
jgi:protein subunit release factor A